MIKKFLRRMDEFLLVREMRQTWLQLFPVVACCVMYPTHPKFDQWCGEAWAILHALPRMQFTEERPFGEFLYQILGRDFQTDSCIVVYEIEQDYGRSTKNFEEVGLAYQRYVNKLVSAIYTKGYVSRRTVRGFMMEVAKKSDFRITDSSGTLKP